MKKAAVILLYIVVFALPSFAEEIDTTLTVDRREKEESLGHKLMTVPSFLVSVPVKITRGFTYFVVEDIALSKPVRKAASLFGRVDLDWSLYPIIGYGSNSGLKAGLTFNSKNTFTKGERFKLKGSYSTYNYQDYSFQYTAPNKLGPFKRLYLSYRYRERPRDSFYGLGNESRDYNEVAVNCEENKVGLGWYHVLTEQTRLNFDFSYRNINVYNGEDPDVEGDLNLIEQELNLHPTVLRPSRVWSFGIGVASDSRNHPGQTSSGGHYLFSFDYNKGVGVSDDLEYWTIRGDLWRFINLFKKRILVLRVLVESTDRPKDKPLLPYYLRGKLGGQEDLRGYLNNRFVDNDLFMYSVEYRYPIWDVVDAFLFFNEGRVFTSITDNFSLDDLHYSGGFGFRIWNNRGLLLSTTFCISEEKPRFYLQFSDYF